ncbi:hypothetical protein [Mycolicibacterium sp. HK-90]|uniref:hypothetical protein n=1 Tax=Mycolicibacterium sp. HK-90 TaxID=3056937 RepID=UPI0026591830|nr:hypothetical protein [Mycolicibacterium sp. HK-90]WKG05381.1 hypothetical protein QU592_10015 [Mycolicibacterium sp. HK-90]
MLSIVGGWGNREDSLPAAVDRLQRSLNRAPVEPEKYGAWGFWRRQEDDENSNLTFVPIDINDSEILGGVITTATEQVRRGPNTAPGLYVDLSRPALSQTSETSPGWYQYTARVGFVDRPRPHNRVTFGVDDAIDERTLMGYMSALVEAWQPDHLGSVTIETLRAQGHKGAGPVVGRLTYVRDGTPLNTNVLGDEVHVAEADGGRYIRVPGTPSDPSLEHILEVRRALGYETA